MVKLCECGCGLPAPVATRNEYQAGYLKGEPKRFIRGHSMKVGHPPWWKGDAAGLGAKHTYLRKHFPKTGICDQCGQQTRTEYALIHGREYSRNRDDYRELCKLCHNRYDEIGGSRWRGHVTARARAGDPPSCACGCGEQITDFDSGRNRWRRYRPGHYMGEARRAAQRRR